MVFISTDLLHRLVPMPDAISAVRLAFEKVYAGTVEQPARLGLDAATALVMVARDKETGNTVVKAVSVRPQNAAAGRPAVQALAMWLDGQTGTPEYVIDGNSLTALRTGAASGVATDLLAPKAADVMAMIGAGGQSLEQIRAVCAVRPITEVRIASLTNTRTPNLIARLTSEYPRIRFVAVSSTSEAVNGAEIVCTATDALQPVLDTKDLAESVHINAIGAYRPDMCELPADLLRGATVVAVDLMSAAMAEAGDLIQAIQTGQLRAADIHELGALLADSPRQRSGRTVFKSVGIAAQDLAIADIVAMRALTRPRGQS